MTRAMRGNFYANPAFCQQSEFYQIHRNNDNASDTRQPPVGGIVENSYEEQDFYEEMLVDDDTGIVREKKKIVVVSQINNNNQNRSNSNSTSPVRNVASPTTSRDRYEYISMMDQPGRGGGREANDRISKSPIRPSSAQHRYEYIPMMITETSPSRYAIIDMESDDRTARKTDRGKYALVPLEEIRDSSRHHRYEYIDEGAATTTMTPTQRLHEVLATPPRRALTTPTRKHLPDPFVTPKRRTRAQQKLNYPPAKTARTAVVTPICAGPIKESQTDWAVRIEKPEMYAEEEEPVQMTIAVAALMMFACGVLSSGMCFYMMSLIGKVYYLEFGVASGFACLTLGILGFRTRRSTRLPNRNYISGYIVLSVFSLLTCAALLVLLFVQPRPGTPLADMTSGAVCGISVLSLCLATGGVLSSYCCSVPPPDNRVQHLVPGFTV